MAKVDKFSNFKMTIIFPPKQGNFYFLDPFFDHTHDENSASNTYAIPWDNSIIFVLKRDGKKAGCVGCVVRRIISTTYHKKEKICGVDSVWCSTEIEKDIEFEIDEKNSVASSTKCLMYQFENKSFEEFHVLPVPACNCSTCLQPTLSRDFVDAWIQKWPNIIIQKVVHQPNSLFHINYAKLPNVAPLFTPKKNKNTYVPSPATAASLRDGPNISKRLIGESIERYALHFIPFERLFTSPNQTSSFIKSGLSDLNPPLWTRVVNNLGEISFCKADEVYSGLHKLYCTQFRPLSSSGVAAHTDLESAKTHALLELIERDALLVAWRLADRINLFRYLPSSLLDFREKKWVEKLVARQEQELTMCAVVNQFNLPIVLAITLPKSDSCNFVPNFGSGVSFSWEEACKKAIKELLQGIGIPDTEVNENLPTSFIERPRYWAHPKRLSLLSKRLRPEEQQDETISIFSLNDLVQKFTQLSLPLYFANLTPSDIALSNWKVIRALCPSFEPFVSNAHYEKPSIDRVNHFLSYMDKNPGDHINNDPFPFP